MHSGRACWVTFMSCFHLCVLAYACVAIYVATCSQVDGRWMGRGVCLLLRSSVAWTPDQPSVPPASPCQCRCSMCLVPVFVMPVSCRCRCLYTRVGARGRPGSIQHESPRTGGGPAYRMFVCRAALSKCPPPTALPNAPPHRAAPIHWLRRINEGKHRNYKLSSESD